MLGLLGFFGIAIVGFIAGPKPHFEQVRNTPSNKTYKIKNVDASLLERESKVSHIKPDNQAQIVWSDSTHQKTEYSIVYLHGFTASQGEGYPMHISIADSLNANLYLPRLHGHGITGEDAMIDLTPTLLVEDAKDAIAIGKTLGEKLIVMGCSTGGTLGIYLAANDPEIAALILLSPNIAISDPSSKLLTGPWGKELAYQLIGANIVEQKGSKDKYWSNEYSTNGLIALQSLIDQTMTVDVFEKLSAPIYCGYYYKSEEEQDHVVSVPAMLSFRKSLTLSDDDIEFEAFPEAGHHVICSIYKNKNWDQVQVEVLDFLSREGIK